jgi:hypothetical protein
MSLTTHQLRGFTVTVNNTRPDISTADVITRLNRALVMIDHYHRTTAAGCAADFSGIRVERYACRGAFFRRADLPRRAHVLRPSRHRRPRSLRPFCPRMHARLHTLGIPLELDHARQERFCRKPSSSSGAWRRVVPAS